MPVKKRAAKVTTSQNGHVKASVARRSKREERFPRSDLGTIAREGVPQREMLIPDFIYRGAAHTLHGESGAGKTMIALALLKALIKQGRKVFYLDEENGENEIAKRLLGLGVTADEMDECLLCLSLTEPHLDEAALLVERIAEFEPVFGIFDSAADFYSAASIRENEDAVVDWAKAFTQRLARGHDIATLVLEHENAAGEQRRQRGHTGKKQKMDAQWHVRVLRDFDQSKSGEVEFTRTKDRFGTLPKTRRAEIGGDGTGRIYFELRDARDTAREKAEDDQRQVQAFWKSIEATLRKEKALSREKALSQSQLDKLVPSMGGTAWRTAQMKDCALSPMTKVKSGRKSTRGGGIAYWLEEKKL
jgi:AAA domain